MEISWNNLSLSVPRDFQWKNLTCYGSRNGRKTIFRHLSGKCEPGQLTAILGPSGCGKTSLLNAIVSRCLLTDESDPTNGGSVQGNIEIKGPDCHDGSFRMAFIPQHDNLLAGLTVWESLYFVSKLVNYGILKFPSEHSAAVQKVVSDLKLDSCLNNLVGHCSGGERRRLSVALELLHRPDILIADEITSGLDSSSAGTLVNLLKKICSDPEQQMTILMTIHQPPSRVFQAFDHVYLMGAAAQVDHVTGLTTACGACLYQGSPQELIPKLESINFDVPEYSNPADVALEIASGRHGSEIISQMIGLQTQTVQDDQVLTIASGGYHRNKSMGVIDNLRKLGHHSTCLTIMSGWNIVRNPGVVLSYMFIFLWFPSLFLTFVGRIGEVADCDLTYQLIQSWVVNENDTQQVFKMATVNTNLPVSIAGSFMLIAAMFFIGVSITIAHSHTVKSVVRQLSAEIANGRYTVTESEVSRMVWEAILFLVYGASYSFWNVVLLGYPLTMESFCIGALAMGMMFGIYSEMGRIFSLLLGLRSAMGSMVVAMFFVAWLGLSGELFQTHLRQDHHQLDAPHNLRYILLDNNVSDYVIHMINALYYGDRCPEREVMTNLVWESDPRTKHGLPYHKFNLHGNILQLGFILFTTAYLTSKVVHWFLLNYRLQNK